MYLPVVLFLLHASYGEKIQYKTLEEKLVCEVANEETFVFVFSNFPILDFSRSSKQHTFPNRKKGSKKVNLQKVKLPSGQTSRR